MQGMVNHAMPCNVTIIQSIKESVMEKEKARKNYIELAHMFLTALEDSGFDVLSALEQWNTIYKPEIKALNNGRYTYNIGRTEIKFTIKK